MSTTSFNTLVLVLFTSIALLGCSSSAEDELREWGKEQFAAYKYPRIIEFRDALPMTATGKILKREIA